MNLPKEQDEISLLLERAHEGALATLEGGKPFVSAVGCLYVAGESGSETTPVSGQIYFLLSDLARHTKNIRKHPQVSMHVLEKGDAPAYERRRASAQGQIAEIRDREEFENYKMRYLEMFPGGKIFFTLSDFHFFEIEIAEIYFVGGFGKIQSIR